MNPAVIVISGSMTLTGEHFIAGVREIVYSRTMPLAIEHALSPENVDRMLAARVMA